MNRSVLIAYQWATGLSDTCTGAFLYVAPAFTLRMMGLNPPPDAAPYIGYIGAFVLSVGLACLYGAYLAHLGESSERLETVWLLTAFSRAAVAIYILQAILAGTLQPEWISVVLFDGACVLIQGSGLRRKWLRNAR